MEQELTFHPSRDDSDKLKVFLSRVCQEYEGWKRRRMDALVPSCARKRARSREPVTMVRSPIITEASVTAACASSTNTSQAPLKRHTKKSNKSPRTCKDTTAARKSSSESFVLQLSAATRSSLKRARQIDTSAPDPESVPPSNETEDERRKRLERINGRRKRIKKLIEMDELHQQMLDLSKRNHYLGQQNMALREARCRLKYQLKIGERRNLANAVAEATACLEQPSQPPASPASPASQGEQPRKAKRQASGESKKIKHKYIPQTFRKLPPTSTTLKANTETSDNSSTTALTGTYLLSQLRQQQHDRQLQQVTRAQLPQNMNLSSSALLSRSQLGQNLEYATSFLTGREQHSGGGKASLALSNTLRNPPGLPTVAAAAYNSGTLGSLVGSNMANQNQLSPDLLHWTLEKERRDQQQQEDTKKR